MERKFVSTINNCKTNPHSKKEEAALEVAPNYQGLLTFPLQPFFFFPKCINLYPVYFLKDKLQACN